MSWPIRTEPHVDAVVSRIRKGSLKRPHRRLSGKEFPGGSTTANSGLAIGQNREYTESVFFSSLLGTGGPPDRPCRRFPAGYGPRLYGPLTTRPLASGPRLHRGLKGGYWDEAY